MPGAETPTTAVPEFKVGVPCAPTLSTAFPRDHLTPHRLVVVILVREYCKFKVAVPTITPAERRSANLLMLSLVQCPDLDLATTCIRVGEKVPKELATSWARAVTRLHEKGVAGVMDLTQSIEKLLTAESANVIRSSVLGLLLRRVCLSVVELTFSGVSALRQQLDQYYRAGRHMLARLLEREQGDSLEISLDCDKTKGDQLPSFMPAEFSTNVVENGGAVFREQEDLLMAQQASLLQTAKLHSLYASTNQLEDHFMAKTSPEEKGFSYAAFDPSVLHLLLNHKEEAMSTIKEAIIMSQEASDHTCLRQVLSLMYRMVDSEEKQLLMERCTGKCRVLSPSSFDGVVPELLSRSEVPNCQHSTSELQCNCKAGAWAQFGMSELACTLAQLLLQLNTDESARGSNNYSRESTAMALCCVAIRLEVRGYPRHADKVLDMVDKVFPVDSLQLSRISNTAISRVSMCRALLRQDRAQAKAAVDSLEATGDSDAKLLRAELFFKEGSLVEARELLQQILEVGNENVELTVRSMLLQGDIHCSDGYPAGAEVNHRKRSGGHNEESSDKIGDGTLIPTKRIKRILLSQSNHVEPTSEQNILSGTGVGVVDVCETIAVLDSKDEKTNKGLVDIPQLDGLTDNDENLETVTDSQRMLNKLRSVLDKLLRDDYDTFEVLALARELDVDVLTEASFSKQKLLIQRRVLDNIVKEDPSDDYLRLLDETEKLCNVKRPLGYSCCLVGCLFQADRHRTYIKHLKDVHSNFPKLVCKFDNKCRREFSTIFPLLEHIKQSHSHLETPERRTRVPDLNFQCKCDIQQCGGKKFDNLKLLMVHFNTFHFKDPRKCIFEDCNTQFNANSVSRNHFRLKHIIPKKLQLKRNHLVNNFGEEIDGLGNLNPVENQTMEEAVEAYQDEDFEYITDQTNENEPSGDYFLTAYADFMNRMCSVKFIPHQTLQTIASEFLDQSLKSMELRESKLRASLRKVPGITDEQIEEVVRDVIVDDGMLNAQKELNTDYKRSKFIRDNFKYVPPHEIVLNPEEVERGIAKDVVHYIPVTETFRNLMEDQTFVDLMEKGREEGKSKSGVLKDIKDGSMYQNVDFFKQNPSAMVGIFYSDALEIANPLGAARGRHKVVQIFWTLADIPKNQRSKIDRIQLAMVVKEKLIKKHGFGLIYQHLIHDLRKLEEGIMVYNPVPRIVKCGVLVHSGDNLESHTVGGFSTCFSSLDICRFCHCQFKDLKDHIHSEDSDPIHKPWTIMEYDAICDDLEKISDEVDPCLNSIPISDLDQHLFDEYDDPAEELEDHGVTGDETEDDESEEPDPEASTNKKTFGLRKRCPFNKLDSFHAVYGFTPDLLHDLHEGVIAQDLCGVIKILSLKGWFTIEEYNQALQRHQFKSYEMNDKPQLISSNKAMKLPGKAVSIWLHLRCFGMLIQRFVQDYDDEALALAVELSEISERLHAAEFREWEIEVLDEKIVQYLDLRKQLYDAYPNLLGSPKCKHHYIVHYPEAIRKFGPPMCFWTGRFEAKHRVAKSTAESAKNFKNISATLSTSQQMRMASVFYGGIFDTDTFHLPEKVTKKEDLPDGTEFYGKVKEFMGPSDLLCKKITLNCQQFENGDILVMKVVDRNELEVGVLQAILVKSGNVFFVMKKYRAVLNKLNFYNSKSALETVFFDPLLLVDHKPLVKYGTERSFKFYLHHHISFSYD